MPQQICVAVVICCREQQKYTRAKWLNSPLAYEHRLPKQLSKSAEDVSLLPTAPSFRPSRLMQLNRSSVLYRKLSSSGSRALNKHARGLTTEVCMCESCSNVTFLYRAHYILNAGPILSEGLLNIVVYISSMHWYTEQQGHLLEEGLLNFSNAAV